MSSRKRPLAELDQPRITPSRHMLSTPRDFPKTQHQTSTRLRSARSLRRTDLAQIQPTSARGILRRLAQVTAPATKRRVITPASIPRDKENLVPNDDDDEDEEGLKKPYINFNIEESIDQDDSELLVAPTPTAPLEDTDDDEEQPTLTFQNVLGEAGSGRRLHLSLLPQSDSVLCDAEADEEAEDGNSTYLTERGRRAVSDEPTRMSRYSFGSIRMSDFGTELEIRRESNRQQKLVALEVDDDYGGGFDIEDNIQWGGETEDLRNLRQSSPQSSVSINEESLHAPARTDDSFQLNIPDTDEQTLHATQQGLTGNIPQFADTIIDLNELSDSEHQQIELEATTPATTVPSRRQTLLESVAATAAARPKKKVKMNQRGNMVPSLPSSLIKRIVHDSQEKTGKRKTTLGKEHMKALEQATEWFFEQVSEDVGAYSQHGHRKKRVDTDDVLLLMRRQRVLQDAGDLHKLAKDWLPRELLKDLDLPSRP